MIWMSIFIPVVVTILLLVFFRKQVTYWEIALLTVPSAILILLLNFIMIRSNETDTEYWGSYINKVIYYQAWNEKVNCRHSYSCNCDSKGKNCSTCYEHPYDVDYHPEYWVKVDNYGYEYDISKSEFDILSKRFSTKPYFVDMHRDYYSINGDAYYTNWNKKIQTSEVITKDHWYKNKVQASHSVFKFDNIDEKTKKMWKLYDYPEIHSYYQQCVLGMPVNDTVNRKLQFINGYYGVSSQFRIYIMYFKDQTIEAAFKQRSYMEGGNKNEFIVCIGTDKTNKYQWCKAFSWMDKPELEVGVESWFDDTKNKADLNLFADWLPNQIKQHWKRKHFKDFEYLNVELSENQFWWIMILVALYNIGIAIWIVLNEFKNE